MPLARSSRAGRRSSSTASRLRGWPRLVGNSGSPGPRRARPARPAAPGHLRGERGAAFLAALAGAPDVRAGAQVHVAAGERGELGDPQPGLDGHRQQGVIAAAGPAGAVRGGQQRLGLPGSQVGHDSLVEAGGRDGQDPLDQCRRARGGAGRRSGTASGSRPAARCGSARRYAGRCRRCSRKAPISPASRSSRSQVAGSGAGAGLGEGQQQPERVAVGGHGVAADLALGDQPVGEERLQDRGEGGHGLPPAAASRRPAARASSSGVPVRYQLFRRRNNWYYSDFRVIPIPAPLRA